MDKKPMGRPPLQPGNAKRVLVTLDEATIERGKARGNGNLSRGIRDALNPAAASAAARTRARKRSI